MGEYLCVSVLLILLICGILGSFRYIKSEVKYPNQYRIIQSQTQAKNRWFMSDIFRCSKYAYNLTQQFIGFKMGCLRIHLDPTWCYIRYVYFHCIL